MNPRIIFSPIFIFLLLHSQQIFWPQFYNILLTKVCERILETRFGKKCKCWFFYIDHLFLNSIFCPVSSFLVSNVYLLSVTMKKTIRKLLFMGSLLGHSDSRLSILKLNHQVVSKINGLTQFTREGWIFVGKSANNEIFGRSTSRSLQFLSLTAKHNWNRNLCGSSEFTIDFDHVPPTNKLLVTHLLVRFTLKFTLSGEIPFFEAN